MFKKSLKIPKGYSEVVNQRTDKTMGKTKGYSEVVNQRTDKTMGKTKKNRQNNGQKIP